ncbi:MAG TPA: lysoplasmalogenase [Polyangiaceae bacterium]|jgi:uncharacterized membrane protein YhhN|nr:lysoplasmalogenase [Polyangiaceae bacterium]
MVQHYRSMLATTLTALVAVFLTGLLVAEARDARRAALAWKSAASASFVLLALSLHALDQGPFGVAIFTGLVLAALGDVALALPGERAFFAGLVAFLLGHVAYVIASATMTPPAEWLSPIDALPLLATAAVYPILAPHLGSLRRPVIAYMVTITVMVVAALAVRRAGYVHGDVLAAGAVLFYISDLSVARDRFVRRAFVNRAWGLPAYYAAQLLMAWAARA